jgi:hypothetical protein
MEPTPFSNAEIEREAKRLKGKPSIAGYRPCIIAIYSIGVRLSRVKQATAHEWFNNPLGERVAPLPFASCLYRPIASVLE